MITTESDFKVGVEKARKSPADGFYLVWYGNKTSLTRLSENERDEVYEKV